MKKKYQIGDKIKNPSLSLTVKGSALKPVGKTGRKITHYTVVCERCGHNPPGTDAGTLEKRKVCPGCSGKPAALKTDKAGDCITICELGTVEFIREFQEEHDVSERAAVRQFIETVKAHLPADDPVLDGLTAESVRATTRRQTGKKKEKSTPGAVRPKLSQPKESHDSKLRREMIHGVQLERTPEAVQQFLDNHMPGYEISKKPGQCASCGGVEFYHGYFCKKCNSRGA
jgi:hypothetical protein